MILRLIRSEFTEQSSIGTMSINGAYIGFTIEDYDRGLLQSMPIETIERIKKHGLTAIPYGSYKVKRTWSPKFKKITPEILDVPGFDGIRIHSANYSSQLEGCIAPGLKKSTDAVWASRLAFEKIDALIEKAEANGEDIDIIIAKK